MLFVSHNSSLKSSDGSSHLGIAHVGSIGVGASRGSIVTDFTDKTTKQATLDLAYIFEI
jgi:hypothetical protein